MSGPILSSPSLPAVDCDELATLVDRLNDDQRRFVVQQLLPSLLAGVREPRSMTDADGRLIGYFLPTKSLDGDNLLGVSESGTFRFKPGMAEPSSSQAMRMARRKKERDLFEVDLGGSD
jgi:hypothetical protein